VPFDIHCHVHERGSAEIDLNLMFRDHLRSCKEDRIRYQDLKASLAQDPGSGLKLRSGFTGYTLGNDCFIREILEKTGFDGLCSRFCTHHNEWRTYHTIRSAAVRPQQKGIYDAKDEIFSSPQHHHFVLYKGTEIVGVAHIESSRDETNHPTLHLIVLEPSTKQSGIGGYFRESLNKWAITRTGHLLQGPKGHDSDA